MPALYRFVFIGHCHTQHGVGCLVGRRERTRLTLMTINRAMIVRCKYTKKMIIISIFVKGLFTETLNLTVINLQLA